MTRDEVLEMALLGELGAISFYGRLSSRAADLRLRATLRILMQQEEKHAAELRERLQGAPDLEGQARASRPDPQIPPGDAALDVQTVLSLARRREELSIRTYRALLQAESEPETVALLSELLEEEFQHRDFILKLEREFLG